MAMTKISDELLAIQAQDPYLWAVQNYMMPDGKPYGIYSPPFVMPYLRDVFRAFAHLPRRGRLVFMKAGQMGLTELGKICAFWFMDVRQEGVLYMLRTDGELGQFAQARIDPHIQASPYLERSFTDVDNVHLKIGWGQTLYLRGSVATGKMREIPVGLVVRDEYEVQDPEGAKLAEARLGLSQYQYLLDIGNPKYPEGKLHNAYLEGTQEEWEIKCETCDEWFIPRWPDSVDAERPENLICPNCGEAVDRLQRGRWTAQNPDAPYRSFHISRLVSPRIQPGDFIIEWNAAKGNPTREQVFYNMWLGLPYAPGGAKLDESIIAGLPSSGEMKMSCSQPTVMGVDVGAVLHVVVRLLSGGIIWAGEVDWPALDRLIGAYNVVACGIDAMPETYAATKFAQRFPDIVTLIRYHSSPLSINSTKRVEEGVTVLTVPRTATLDKAFQLIHVGELAVPSTLPADFWRHFFALTRQVVDDGHKTYATYVQDGGRPDHYAHAFNYSEIVREDQTFHERVQVFV